MGPATVRNLSNHWQHNVHLESGPECTWILDFVLRGDIYKRETSSEVLAGISFRRWDDPEFTRVRVDTGCVRIRDAQKVGEQILSDEGVHSYVGTPPVWEIRAHQEKVKQCNLEAPPQTWPTVRSRHQPLGAAHCEHPPIGQHRAEYVAGVDESLTLYIGKAHDLSSRHAFHEKKHLVMAAWWKSPLGTRLLLETWNCERDETQGAEKWLESCYGLGLFNVAGIGGNADEPFGRQERWDAQAICFFGRTGRGVYRWSLHPTRVSAQELRGTYSEDVLKEIRQGEKISHRYIPSAYVPESIRDVKEARPNPKVERIESLTIALDESRVNPVKARRVRRTRSNHPGVVLAERKRPGSGTSWRARYTDPNTGAVVWKTLDAILSTKEARAQWAKNLSRSLAHLRANLAVML